MTGHPHQWFGGVTHAQHGDDLAVLNVFKRLGIECGTYIDVGAHHPFELSNTALLYERGWRGVNVEANPDLLAAFDRARPEDRNLCAAVLGEPTNDGFTSLYRANRTSGINSTVPENMQPHGITSVVEAAAATLPQIVQDYCSGKWPDFLSIDAEGQDVAILETVPHGASPVVLVEAVSPVRDATDEIRKWANQGGYFVHSWCGFNMLLVRDDLRTAVC